VPGSFSLVGTTVSTAEDPATYNGLTDRLAVADACDSFISTGLTPVIAPARAVQKWYFGVGELPTVPQADMAELAAAGCSFLISYKPSPTFTATEDNAFLASMRGLLNHGISFKVVLWQEMNLASSGWSGGAAAFHTYFAHYAPIIRQAGVLAVFDPGGSDHTSAVAYYPGDQWVDWVMCDFYCGSYQAGGVNIDPIEQLADNHKDIHGNPAPVPFGVAEWMAQGASSKTPSQSAWDSYTGYLRTKFTSRPAAGKNNAWVIGYNSSHAGRVANVLWPSAAVASASGGGTIQNVATWSNPAPGVLEVTGNISEWPNTASATNSGALPYRLAVKTANGWAYVNYTDVSGQKFLGCSYDSGATGTVSTGAVVADYKVPAWQRLQGSLTPGGNTVTVTSPGAQAATVGAAVNLALSATDSQAGQTFTWTAVNLPAGLSINATTGHITGTPTAPAAASVTATATDTTGASGSVTFTWVINPAPAITTTSLPGAVTNVAYSAAVTGLNGTTPYAWTVSSGSLPAGLSLNSSTGVISGTPTGSGTASFTVKLTDADGITATKALSITVAAVAITTTSLPGGTVAFAYSATVAGAGGTTPYTWSILSGSLPASLSLNATTGIISGTPTGAGTSSFTVKLTDHAGNTATQALSITIAPALSVATTQLPWATPGEPYTAMLAEAGGTGPFTWAVTTGTLPPGLVLAPAGTISGTPELPSFPFTVTVTDANGTTATQTLIIYWQLEPFSSVPGEIVPGETTPGDPGTLQALAPQPQPPPPPPPVPVPLPPPFITPPATPFKYVTTDLRTGKVLCDALPLTVQSFSRQLNQAGQLTGNLSLQQVTDPANLADPGYAVNQKYLAALEPRRSVLWVLQAGFPVWAGIVWDWPAMTLQGGQIPISAQTFESLFDHRLITADITYQQVDLFAAFIDLVKYGISKQSPYITATNPAPPATPDIVAAAAVPQLILPTGPAAVSGVSWSANYTYSDLQQISSVWQDMAASGNLEYSFDPGLDGNGNLAIFLRLGYTQLGRQLPDSGIALTYPGNVTDYGYQRTGSQGGNTVWGTAPPNGAPLTWISAYPHGYDLTDLTDGYPLLETSVSWTGSWVTSQAQIDGFADGQLPILTNAMTIPTVSVPGDRSPTLRDMVLGDQARFTATSAMHPPKPGGKPGLQTLLRITGWTCTPPDNGQTQSVQLATSTIGVVT